MKRTILFLLCFLTLSVFSQSVSPYFPSAAVGNSTNGNIGLSWTAGELIVGTFEAEGITLTQGFHQVNHLIVNIHEKGESPIRANVWPNPAQNILNIEVDQSSGFYDYQLVSLQGAVVETGAFESDKQLNVSSLPSGMYVLKIVNEDKFLLIKIVKL